MFWGIRFGAFFPNRTGTYSSFFDACACHGLVKVESYGMCAYVLFPAHTPVVGVPLPGSGCQQRQQACPSTPSGAEVSCACAIWQKQMSWIYFHHRCSDLKYPFPPSLDTQKCKCAGQPFCHFPWICSRLKTPNSRRDQTLPNKACTAIRFLG